MLFFPPQGLTSCNKSKTLGMFPPSSLESAWFSSLKERKWENLLPWPVHSLLYGSCCCHGAAVAMGDIGSSWILPPEELRSIVVTPPHIDLDSQLFSTHTHTHTEPLSTSHSPRAPESLSLSGHGIPSLLSQPLGHPFTALECHSLQWTGKFLLPLLVPLRITATTNRSPKRARWQLYELQSSEWTFEPGPVIPVVQLEPLRFKYVKELAWEPQLVSGKPEILTQVCLTPKSKLRTNTPNCHPGEGSKPEVSNQW